MADEDVHAAIERLVEEEHELLEREAAEGPSEATRRRAEELQVMLDRLWDLLRQRRALRAAGQSPDDASLRDAETVETYEQ
jgi:hypothetical protein